VRLLRGTYWITIYRAFHKVLRDYKNLLQENRRTRIYPLIFFLWGYVKDRVFVPPLPRDLAGIKPRINAAVKNIDAPMLTRVWQELEYRIDVCRVTSGAHSEHL